MGRRFFSPARLFGFREKRTTSSSESLIEASPAFHGHQASTFFSTRDYLSHFVLRYPAKPLSIRNTSIKDSSRRRFSTEYRSTYDSLRWAIAGARLGELGHRLVGRDGGEGLGGRMGGERGLVI